MIQYLFELIVIPITDGLVIDILSQLFVYVGLTRKMTIKAYPEQAPR
ncbi:hypothetical protein [Pseudolactococcus raffinolactis]|nr:hypothetical protein [Lactococcus raffinolactis]PCS13256.1 hypothetical protein RU88_GL000134 [Lactococcus raffinolactis]